MKGECIPALTSGFAAGDVAAISNSFSFLDRKVTLVTTRALFGALFGSKPAFSRPYGSLTSGFAGDAGDVAPISDFFSV